MVAERKGAFGIGGAILFVLAGLGIALALYRFATGLGSVTNLNQGYPWGLWIGFDILAGIALAAGGFVVGGLMHMFGGEKYEPLVRPTILTALLGYLLFIVALLVDLGRPWTIWHMIIMWHHESPMFEVGWCVMLYTTILLVEFLPVVFERFHMTRLHKLWKYSAPWIAIALLTLFAVALTQSVAWVIVIAAVLILFQLSVEVGAIYRDPKIPTLLLMAAIIFSTLHQSSLGTLFLMVPHKLHVIWYSPLLPVFFLVSAVATGLAMTIFESILSARFFGRKVETDLLRGVGRFLSWAIICYLGLRGVDLIVRGVGSELLVRTPQCAAFWVEIIVGSLIPLAILLTPELVKSATWLFSASVMVVVGLIVNRLNVAWVGISSRYEVAYYPHWMEIAITVGLVSAGVLVFVLVCRYFPIFSEERSPTGAR